MKVAAVPLPRRRSWCLALPLVALAWLPAVTPAALPEPLTFAAALAQADQPHPDVETVRADLLAARADLEVARSDKGLKVDLSGRLRWVDPATGGLSSRTDDHALILSVQKLLYDFGRTAAEIEAAQLDLESQRRLLAARVNQRRLEIAAAYFNVLLADMQYSRDNEEMAIAYVRFDAVRDRAEQGLVSDVDLLKAEARYQEVRRKRYASDVARRARRAELAALLNHPGELSSDLEEPALRFDQLNKLPQVEELEAQALKNNPALIALQARLEAARQRVAAAKAGRWPEIEAEFDTATYTRKFYTRDDFRVGLTFSVPLYDGGLVKGEVAGARADLIRLQAERTRKEMEVRLRVLELWQEIYVLRAQRDEAEVKGEYRDLYLDRSRALYELDLRTDLGDAMVQFSASRLYAAKTRYRLALALAELAALRGERVFPQWDGKERNE